MNEPSWYVAHTYSGYENKVKANIEKIVENRGLQEEIIEVVVPMQDAVIVKDGVKKTVKQKVMPGYVLLKMHMNDDTWYVVRNTRGVTSFVGPGSKPVALTEDEIARMGVDEVVHTIDLDIGDSVRVTSGPFDASIGMIKKIDESKKTVTVMLSVFGRETPVELDFTQIVKTI